MTPRSAPSLRATTTTRQATPRTTVQRGQKPALHDLESPLAGGNPETESEALTEAHSGSRSWVLRVPAPGAWMSLNDRPHWARRAKLTKLWRGAAHVYAGQAKLPKGLEAAHISARVVKGSNRAYDVHNLIPTVKAAIDGLIDYGLLADDSNEYLTGPDMRPGGVGTAALVLVITESHTHNWASDRPTDRRGASAVPQERAGRR